LSHYTSPVISHFLINRLLSFDLQDKEKQNALDITDYAKT
jgi:hypothetical protein